MAPAFNILLTSVGRRVSLVRAFRRALEGLGVAGKVLAVDRSPTAPALHLADEGRLVPPVDDPAYIGALLEICREHQVGVVIPLIDSELAVMAEARGRFAPLGVRVLVSSPEVVRLCRDKQLTYEFLKAQGLGTPAVFSYEEALRGPFPLLMKPRFGSRGLGHHFLPDRPALVQQQADREASIIQEYVTGDEFTVDVYAGLSGVPTVAVPRRRIEVRDGEVSKAQTVRHPRIIAESMALVAALRQCAGVVTIQCFLTPAGAIKFIEINPRFGGGVPLAIEAGADFPRWILQELLGRPADAGPEIWKDGLFMLRYEAEVFRRWGDLERAYRKNEGPVQRYACS